MVDRLEELDQIAKQFEELETKARAIELHKTLKELETAALQIGQAWSRSWFGYQAYVYYRGWYGRGDPKTPGISIFQQQPRLIRKRIFLQKPYHLRLA